MREDTYGPEDDRMMPAVVVLGQAGRDLVLQIPALPDAGGSTPVHDRVEIVGGKGVNQAVGLRQLGASVRLIAVLGTDTIGDGLMREVSQDEINTDWVVRRGSSALAVDIIDDGDHSRRLLEHVPTESQVTPGDVQAAVNSGVFDGADTICLQLQQPIDGLLLAARAARERNMRVVLDGAVEGRGRDELLSYASVVRADASEAEILAAARIDSVDVARQAAQALLKTGPEIVVLTVKRRGEFVAWNGGEAFIPHRDEPVIDPTGAGDAFVAGLVTGLRAGRAPRDAAQLASTAAAATIGHPGGRPDLGGLRTKDRA